MHVPPTGFDIEVYHVVTDHRTQPWIAVARTLTWLGNTLVLTVAVLLVVAALAAARRFGPALMVAAGSLTGYLLMIGLKDFFGRQRPPVGDQLVHAAHNSFPSGHAMMTMVCFGLFAAAAWQTLPWVRAHWSIVLVAPVCSIVVGLTRVCLGVHWATDLLAGWAIGALWVLLWVGLCRLRQHRWPKR